MKFVKNAIRATLTGIILLPLIPLKNTYYLYKDSIVISRIDILDLVKNRNQVHYTEILGITTKLSVNSFKEFIEALDDKYILISLNAVKDVVYNTQGDFIDAYKVLHLINADRRPTFNYLSLVYKH